MLATMPKSVSKKFLQKLFHLNLENNINLIAQMQERIVKLQQVLKLELLLCRINEMVRSPLDESTILNATVQELALKLEEELFRSFSKLYPISGSDR